MFLSLFLLIPLVAAALPNVDFDRMGNVALVGAFAGLDLFQNDSVAFDSATSTLFSRDASGALTRIASTNAGGRILAGCALADTFYFSGLFTTINGVSATNVAAYNPKNNAVTALSINGPNGQVDALFCDAKGKKVWAGGAFSSPASAVAVWDVSASSWQQPPFGGLAGAQAKVLSITTNSSDSSLFFAGSFVTSFGSSRVLNGTNNPNVPFSAGATPFSSSLVPIPLAANQIQGAPSSSDSGFGDIKNILCPAGSDGPGNSWFAGDGSEALITIRTFSFMSVSGVRLGNTFQNNHGTTSFSVTTLPDNVVETLQYVDAVTGENRTCSGNCPLGTDSSVLYQDFLFSNSKAITGAQIKLSGHTGASAGLHMLQLLSSGAFASSVAEDNSVSCFAPNPSNTTRTGTWNAKVANTEISGTVQTVLISDVAVNTPSASGPTYTWIPYVSAAGNYDINLLVPGCTNFQDCAGRTSVKVVVFPGEGLPPNVMTISQRNTDDATVLIYSGPILPSSPNFVTTVTMSLADDPEGNGQGGRYVVVADRVQLVLRSANIDGTTAGNSSTTAVGGQRGFGFLEWPRASTLTADGTSSLPNTSITALDALGFDVLAGIGGTTGLTSTPLSIAAVAHHSSGTIYVGGSFSLTAGPASGASNILAYRNGALSALPDGGLDGAVTSLVLDGDRLFIGGSFRDTKAKTANGLLRGLALYDVAKNTWTALGAGVNGDVADLGLMGGRLQATGNFTEIVSTQTGFGTDAAGIASWDIASGSWVSSGGFTAGRLTMVADGSSNNQYVAGNVGASRKYGASGMIMLKNGKDGVPQITPIASALGHSAQRTASTGATTSATPSRRSLHATTSWIARSKAAKLFARQTPSSTTLAALPPVPASPAPAVLAGTFWQQNDKELTIVGGNFSFVASGASSLSQAVAIYDPTSGSLRGLSGTQLSGTVRAILRDNNKLYVGGEFTMADTNVNGLAIYDLSTQQWDISGLQPLQAAAGAAPVVRSITKATAGSGNIVVAGSFTQAGSLRCAGVCMLDATSKQWNTLGGGIQGEVASIVYAAEGQNVLFAGGSLALTDNTAGNVLQYTFNTSSWTVLGSADDFPGPVTAVEANNGDASNVFAGGHSGSGPFLTHWDGQKWTHLDSSLVGDTAISHLAMVPLQEDHAAQGAIQKDRMLLVSGSLVDSKYGNVSSALYDGQTIIPYIVASSSTGSSGSVSSLFRSFATFSFQRRKFLAVGVVILISIAIAAGVVFLIALIGILWTLFSRKDDKLTKYEGEEEEDDSTHHRPSSLLEHINAATRTTILGTTSPYSNDYSDKDEDRAGKSDVHDPFAADASNYVRAETPSEAAGGMLQEETSRPAHARYSFDGTGEGELPISAGVELEVLDDRDPA
ncbi:hypothetical protein D9611_000155 [Ephemerocybe angulata]|uniref:Uncharacterized protein n=1 Tax=Ephemerocybe angulata TaxID=980116 RepID=A0A8H5BMX5_9AGAR|nr:hypothetical protein D9611_000155 [Tulosesus angulatus]